MQDAFVFTKTQYYLSSDWGAGMERGSLGVWGWPPRDGNPQATPGLSMSEITWIPLEFFHPNLYSFLTNTIKLILSWKGAFKKLPFLLVERRVSYSFTSSPKTTAQTLGLAEVPWCSRGTWDLASLPPDFTPEVNFNLLVTSPPLQWAEQGWLGGECHLWPRRGWPGHSGSWAGKDSLVRSAKEASLSSFFWGCFSKIQFPNCSI